jgi:hypothetical protein
MTLLDPRGFSGVVEWSDQMSSLLEEKSKNYPRLDDLNDWQRWAQRVFCDNNPLGQNAPDPFTYPDWKEWAERLFAVADFSG